MTMPMAEPRQTRIKLPPMKMARSRLYLFSMLYIILDEVAYVKHSFYLFACVSPYWVSTYDKCAGGYKRAEDLTAKRGPHAEQAPHIQST